MAKTKVYYECQNCGRRSPRAMGKCPNCGEFNTMIEVVEKPEAPMTARAAGPVRSKPQRLREVSAEAGDRYPVPVEELSRVLGGGLVPGSVRVLASAGLRRMSHAAGLMLSWLHRHFAGPG